MSSVRSKKPNFLSMFVERHTGILFILPASLIAVLLLIYPVFSSLYFGFTDRSLLSDAFEMVGLANYRVVLSDPAFWTAFKNSIVWTASSIVMQLGVGLGAALMLHRITRFKGLFRTILILPWAFPTIVVAFTWKWLYNDMYGAFNAMLLKIGLINQPVMWLSDPDMSMFSMVIVNTWFGFPFMMISILAGLQSISKDEYEAAAIDGASGWQSFVHITMAHLRVVIGLLVVLRTIWVFNNFDLIFLMTGGGPGTSTETLPLYAYRTGWVLSSLGKASAIATILLVFLLIVSSLYFTVLKKWERSDH